MDTINGANVPEAYLDGLWKLRVCAKAEPSRNGPVFAMPRPVMLTIHNPWERVLIDRARKPNPYFHLAEFVWMMAGSNDARWLSKFNSNMMSFSDDGVVFKAAYGHRWRQHFEVDQILEVIRILREDPTSRRAVIAMWDPDVDFGTSKDVPCNTTIYFRVNGGFLDMTVCNRSNDYIWGMMGANCVHMTMLQELIAVAVGVGMGKYYVFTNNLHVYKNLPNFDEIMSTTVVDDHYRMFFKHIPLVDTNEDVNQFLEDCERFLWTEAESRHYKTKWFRNVFLPMMQAYELRKRKMDEGPVLELVQAMDWRLAGQAWKRWKDEEANRD